MKKLFIILFLSFVARFSFAQVKVDATGNIIPTGSYPAVNGQHVKGVLHLFQTIAQRNALPTNFRDTGMLAYVVDSSKYYYLNNSLLNSAWTEFQIKGGFFSTNHPWPVQSIADMLALDSVKIGDIAIVADSTKSYVLFQQPSSTQSNWLELLNPVLSNTDYLAEGVTHLYYTDARARNSLHGAGIITYDATTGTFSASGYQLPYNGDSSYYLGGDTLYHKLASGSGSGTDDSAYHTATSTSDTSYELRKPNGDKTVFIYESDGSVGSGSGSGSGVQSVTAGENVTVTGTASNPIVNAVLNNVTLQYAFDNSPNSVPQINAHGNRIIIDSSDLILRGQFIGHNYSSGITNRVSSNIGRLPSIFMSADSDTLFFVGASPGSGKTTMSFPNKSSLLISSVNGYKGDAAGNVLLPISIPSGFLPTSNGAWTGFTAFDTAFSNQTEFKGMPDSGFVSTLLPVSKKYTLNYSPSNNGLQTINVPVFTVVGIPNSVNDTFYNKIYLHSGDMINGAVDTVIYYRGGESYSFMSDGSGYRIISHTGGNYNIKYKSSDPTVNNIHQGTFQVYTNTTTGHTYLWANVAGTLMKTELTP